MNRIYRLVFNRALGQVQVASEASSGAGTALRTSAPRALPRIATLALACLGMPAMAVTLPSGFVVNSGSASSNSPNADTLVVTQISNKAVLSWNSFDIGAGGSVLISAPSANAVTINMVTGATFSNIAGSLSGNGQVFLINPNGILFGAGATVNVGGLVASTLPLTGGASGPTYQFAGDPLSSAGIVNQGTLTASGSVTLLGASVANQGAVSADTINLLAGSSALLQTATSPLDGGLVYEGSVNGVVGTAAGSAAITNIGTLLASNALSLKAALDPGLSFTAINLNGVATANALDGTPGNLSLVAAGGAITQGGTVTAGRASVSADSGYTQPGGYLVAGELSLNTAGNTNLGAALNRISTLDGLVQGNLSLVNRTALTQTGALQVSGTTSLDNGPNAITLTNANNSFGGVVSLSGGAISLGTFGTLALGSVDAASLAASASRIELHGAINTAGSQQYAGAVSLATDATLTSTGGGNITFGNTVDGAHNLAVNTAGVTGFNGAVGGTSALGSLVTDSAGSTRLGGGVTTLGLSSIGDDLALQANTTLQSILGDVAFGGRIDGAWSLNVITQAHATFNRALGSVTPLAGLSVNAAGGTQLGADITALGPIGFDHAVTLVNDAIVTSQGGNVDFGATVDGNRLLAVNAPGLVSFGGAVGASSRVGGLLVHAGQFSDMGIAVTGPLSLNIGSSISQGGAYEAFGLATFQSTGDIVLTHAGNNFLGPVSLRGRDAFLAGGSLQVDGVDVRNLAVNADSVLLQNAHVADDAVFTTHGVYTGALEVGGDLSIDAGTGGISGGAVQVGGNATLVAAQNVVLDQPGNRFGGVIDLTAAVGSLSSAGTLHMGNIAVSELSLHGGRIELSGDVTTAGAQSYYGALALQRDTTFTGSALNFIGSIDGAHALVANAGGDTTFDGAFGAQSALASLRTNAGGRTWLSGTILASGNVDFGDAAFLADDTQVTSTAGSIHFGNALGSPHALVLKAANAVTLDGAVGASLRLQSLRVEAGRLDAGTIRVSDGLAIDVRDDLVLGDIQAGSMHASTRGNLTLNGAIGANTAELAADGLFRNLAGGSAITTAPGGYWRIYLAHPNAAHVYGGLDSGNRAVWNTPAFATTTASGNRYLFAYQPTLTFASLDAGKTYGEVIDLSGAWVAQGAMPGVTGAYRGDTVAELFSGAPAVSSTGAAATAGVAGGPYVVQVSKGTLDAGDSGYAIAFDSAGRLSVTPASLTVTAGNASKTEGEDMALTGYSVTGLLNGDTLDTVDLSSGGAGASAAAGIYAINATGAQGSGLGNYTIRYISGVLTVTAGPVDPVDPVVPIDATAAALLARSVNALRPFQPLPFGVAAREGGETAVRDGGLHLPSHCEPREGDGCVTLRLP